MLRQRPLTQALAPRWRKVNVRNSWLFRYPRSFSFCHRAFSLLLDAFSPSVRALITYTQHSEHTSSCFQDIVLLNPFIHKWLQSNLMVHAARRPLPLMASVNNYALHTMGVTKDDHFLYVMAETLHRSFCPVMVGTKSKRDKGHPFEKSAMEGEGALENQMK